MTYFFQGLTMGLAYVAPIGLQNLFVIQGALASSRRRALLTALIVIFFDVTLALACFFGVGALLQHFPWLERLILLVGGVIVVAIGVGLLRAKGAQIEGGQPAPSISKTISSACVVTWCNPQAILDGTMMLGAFYVTLPAGSSAVFIIGVACASCLWFTGLTVLVSVLRRWFSPAMLRGVNLVCGVVILFYGGKLLVHFAQLMLG